MENCRDVRGVLAGFIRYVCMLFVGNCCVESRKYIWGVLVILKVFFYFGRKWEIFKRLTRDIRECQIFGD